MPRILPLTANLLWETTLTFSAWSPGATQRASAESLQVGGKGINVALALAKLGAEHCALCFPGGHTGQLCENWLRAQPALTFAAFSSHAPATRTGLVIRSPNQPDTTFLAPDRAVPREAIHACEKFLTSQPRDSVLAICGSIPGWETETADAFRSLLTNWRGALIVDTYGPPLHWLADRSPALIKINRGEFDGFSPPKNSSAPREDLAARLEKIAAEKTAAAWIVTDGPHPVFLCEKGGAARGFEPPKVQEISATGCGDLLLASLLHSHFNEGKSWQTALLAALPIASALAAQPRL